MDNFRALDSNPLQIKGFALWIRVWTTLPVDNLDPVHNPVDNSKAVDNLCITLDFLWITCA